MAPRAQQVGGSLIAQLTTRGANKAGAPGKPPGERVLTPQAGSTHDFPKGPPPFSWVSSSFPDLDKAWKPPSGTFLTVTHSGGREGGRGRGTPISNLTGLDKQASPSTPRSFIRQTSPTTCYAEHPVPSATLRAVQAGQDTAACLPWVSTAAHHLPPRSTVIPWAKGANDLPGTPSSRPVCLFWAALGNVNHWFFSDVPLTSTRPLLPRCPLLSLPPPHRLLKCRGSWAFSLWPFSLSSSSHTFLITPSTTQGCKYYPTVEDAQVTSPTYLNCLLDTFSWSGHGPPTPSISTPDSPSQHTPTLLLLSPRGERL